MCALGACTEEGAFDGAAAIEMEYRRLRGLLSPFQPLPFLSRRQTKCEALKPRDERMRFCIIDGVKFQLPWCTEPSHRQIGATRPSQRRSSSGLNDPRQMRGPCAAMAKGRKKTRTFPVVDGMVVLARAIITASSGRGFARHN